MFANLPTAAIVRNIIASGNGPRRIFVSIPEIKRIQSLDEEVSPLNEPLRVNGGFYIDLMTPNAWFAGLKPPRKFAQRALQERSLSRILIH